MSRWWRLTHRTLYFSVKPKGEPLHLTQVPLALFRAHLAADVLKMPQHLRLTLRPQHSQLDQLLIDDFTGRQRFLHFALLRCDFRAHLATLREVSNVQLPNPAHLPLAQTKF